MFKVIFVHEGLEPVIGCLIILGFEDLVVNFLLGLDIHEFFNAESFYRVTFIHVHIVDYMQYFVCLIDFMIVTYIDEFECIFWV